MYGGGEGEEAGEVEEAGEGEEAREGMPKNLIFSSDIMLPQIQLLNQGCAKKYNFYFFFNIIKVGKIIQISIKKDIVFFIGMGGGGLWPIPSRRYEI